MYNTIYNPSRAMSSVSSRNSKRGVAFLAVLVLNLGVQYTLTRLHGGEANERLETLAASMRRSWNASSSISHSIPLVDRRNNTLKASKSFNSAHLAHLPLTSWELESAGSERICNPSDGIPNYCCLGSTAWGGIVQHLQEKCSAVSCKLFQAP